MLWRPLGIRPAAPIVPQHTAYSRTRHVLRSPRSAVCILMRIMTLVPMTLVANKAEWLRKACQACPDHVTVTETVTVCACGVARSTYEDRRPTLGPGIEGMERRGWCAVLGHGHAVLC
jgi:hypothetical protein